GARLTQPVVRRDKGLRNYKINRGGGTFEDRDGGKMSIVHVQHGETSKRGKPKVAEFSDPRLWTIDRKNKCEIFTANIADSPVSTPKATDPVAANRIHPNDQRKISQYLHLYTSSSVLPSRYLQDKAMTIGIAYSSVT
ncbi:hypothetical protein M8C21_007173, partial [Ambrosia artemisiifolia]